MFKSSKYYVVYYCPQILTFPSVAIDLTYSGKLTSPGRGALMGWKNLTPVPPQLYDLIVYFQF